MGHSIPVDLRKGGGVAANFITGSIEVESTAMHTSGAALVLPDPVKVPITNGTATLDLEPSPAGEDPAWGYKVTIRSNSGRAWAEYVSVPAGSGPTAYTALPRLTASPSAPPLTTWHQIVEELQTATQAAIDAAGLVGAPAGSAVLAAISEGGAARGELNAAIGDGFVEANSGVKKEVLTAGGLTARDATKAVIQSARQPLGPLTAKAATKTVFLPAGDYHITEPGGLLAFADMTERLVGLRIKGAGSDNTRVYYEPSTAGALMQNDYWRNIAVEGISFHAMKPDLTFFDSNTSQAAQQYTFTDVHWRDGWKYAFDLKGTDNNSEYSFYACANINMQNNGAFLYVGPTNTSEQFLNYWFYGFKHWSTSAPVIDAAKGGHYHIYGMDCSDWGVGLTAPGKLIYLRGTAFASGAKTLTVDGLRAEFKNNHAGLLFSEWAHGTVSIQADVNSHRTTYTWDNMVELRFVQDGPLYHFHDSEMAGKIQISYDTNAGGITGKAVTVSNTIWRQVDSPSDVVVYDRSQAGTQLGDPLVRFVRCKGSQMRSNGIAGDPGAAIWDATIGYNRGAPVASIEKRSVRLRQVDKTMHSGYRARVILPVGAIVTGLRVVHPVGVTADTSTPTWWVQTVEATPVEIMRTTATRTMAQGFVHALELTAPHYCVDKAKATLDVGCTGLAVAGATNETIVILEGYW